MSIHTIIASAIVIIVPVGFLLPEVNVKCGENIGGMYSILTQHIYVCDVPNKEMYTEHELGHHVWFHGLTEKQRSQYTALYHKALARGDRAFYRTYSKQSILEDFADNFYLARKKIKSNIFIQQRVRFIERMLNKK